MSISRKSAIAGAGVAAVALGAGLFAWSSANLTATGGEAVAGGDVSAGCTTAAVTVAQNAPVWDGTMWTLDGATVSTGPDASSTCDGAVVTLTGYDAGGSEIPGLSGVSTTISGTNGIGSISEAITWTAADFNGVTTWSVSIA